MCLFWLNAARRGGIRTSTYWPLFLFCYHGSASNRQTTVPSSAQRWLPPSPFRPPFCFTWLPPDHMITGSLFIVYLMHPVDSINLCSFIIHNSPPWPWKTLELTIGRAHPIGLHFYPYHLTPPRKKEEAHQVGHLCAHVVPRGSIS